MSLILDLGVKIGDSVSIPIGGKEGLRHVAQIVGPAEFPKSDMVYLAPPKPDRDGNIWVYNPATNVRRRPQKVVDIDDNDMPIWAENPPGLGEIEIQGIHMGYTLFERAQK